MLKEDNNKQNLNLNKLTIPELNDNFNHNQFYSGFQQNLNPNLIKQQYYYPTYYPAYYPTNFNNNTNNINNNPNINLNNNINNFENKKNKLIDINYFLTVKFFLNIFLIILLICLIIDSLSIKVYNNNKPFFDFEPIFFTRCYYYIYYLDDFKLICLISSSIFIFIIILELLYNIFNIKNKFLKSNKINLLFIIISILRFLLILFLLSISVAFYEGGFNIVNLLSDKKNCHDYVNNNNIDTLLRTIIYLSIKSTLCLLYLIFSCHCSCK